METTPTARAAALLLALGLLTSCGGDAGTTGSDPTSDPVSAEAPSGSGPGGTGADDGGTVSADADGGTASADDDAGDDDASDDGPDAAGEVTLTISGFAYEVPDAVAPGAEITVTNEDSVGHTVTSDDDGATFDVTVGPGETVTFAAPEEAGEFDFFCRPHPNMTGTLVVEG